MAAAEVSNMNGKEQPTSPTGPLRKRRRRVPTTGASEDCHTCRKRELKCDRRRPYCSQCLDVGKDCSGYRTTLTWGVGVASRGKLRGMSLPVAKPAGQETSTQPSTPQFGRPRASTLQTPAGTSENHDEGPRKRVRLSSLQTNAPSGFPIHTQPDQTHFAHQGHGSPHSFANWQQYPYPSQMATFNGYHDNFNPAYSGRREDLFPLHTAVGHSFTGLPWSPGSSAQSASSSSFFDNSMTPFTNFPRGPAPTAFVDPFAPHQQFQSPPIGHAQSRASDASQTSPLAPQMSQTPPVSEVPFGSSLRSASFSNESQQHPRDSFTSPQFVQPTHIPKPSEARPNLKRTRSAPEVPPSSKIDKVEEANGEDRQVKPHSNSVVSFQPSPPLRNPNVSARILNLLDYYDKKICPVLVTFDNDSNPYRKHIMHLAMQNSGLQNALGALVTNNIRMRCLKEVPSLANGTHREIITKAIGAPTPEEQHYKAKSIDFLNTQLADSNKAVDNSVLATLLILCLFHVCDSGFSKFKTQLAGVQKLLRMRSGMPRTEFHGWVEMFFAWFDVMTSAVNDRETQIQGQVLDLMDLGNNLGSVEEFSGCDGKLFKLIARLGRLNLLSQQRPVRELADSPSTTSPSSYADTFFFNDIFGFSNAPLDMTDSNAEFPLQELSNLDRGPQHDSRAQFWLEWHSLHERLHAWKNSQPDEISLESPRLSVGQLAMLHMSESFRWSALLYLERLANPTVPSSSPNLQDLVGKALYHIREIGTNSCVTKFMLWPLFISGTECVATEHRDLIRDRCIEIQKESGFYNNISGLEVLERVWRDHDEDAITPMAMKQGCGQQAFRWRNCMDRADGEYIVI